MEYFWLIVVTEGNEDEAEIHENDKFRPRRRFGISAVRRVVDIQRKRRSALSLRGSAARRASQRYAVANGYTAD